MGVHWAERVMGVPMVKVHGILERYETLRFAYQLHTNQSTKGMKMLLSVQWTLVPTGLPVEQGTQTGLRGSMLFWIHWAGGRSQAASWFGLCCPVCIWSMSQTSLGCNKSQG